MNKLSKFLIVSALMSVSAAAAYSQDCNRYLRQASELVSQKKYCDARKYYIMYRDCDADADVSTEIAMCERYCRIQDMEGREDEPVVETRREDKPAPTRATTDSRATTDNRTATDNRATTDSRTSSGNHMAKSKQGFSGFQLHGGVLLPRGDCALGYNMGFKVYVPISPVNGLSWFLGADAFYNSLNSEFKNKLAEAVEAEGYDYFTPSAFLNVPVTAGVNYAFAISNKFSIYGEVASGLNLSKYTDTSARSGDDDSYKLKWNMTMGFIYGLEAGVLLFNKITVGVRYNDFGSYKYKGKEVVENNGARIEYDANSEKITQNGISISLGILF